jgi:hypothetical protein
MQWNKDGFDGRKKCAFWAAQMELQVGKNIASRNKVPRLYFPGKNKVAQMEHTNV